MKIKLTEGRCVELFRSDFNHFGQVNLLKLVERGISKDTVEMCLLLGSNPSEVRYGMVPLRMSSLLLDSDPPEI